MEENLEKNKSHGICTKVGLTFGIISTLLNILILVLSVTSIGDPEVGISIEFGGISILERHLFGTGGVLIILDFLIRNSRVSMLNNRNEKRKRKA